MANSIAALIESSVSGLMSEALSNAKNKVWNRIEFYRFNKNLSKWVRQFINTHDGTALTSDDFEKFLVYHKPIEKIIDAIVGDNPLNTSKALVDEIVSQFKKIHSDSNSITCLEEMDIRDLFTGIYQRMDHYYRKRLSDSERYMVAQSKKIKGEIIAAQKESGMEIKKEFLKIQELLHEGQQIKSEDVRWIYREVGKLLADGKADEVSMLLPLLNSSAPDLEYAIPYLLRLMSDCDVECKNFAEIQAHIKDDDINSDIVRKTIYYSLATGERHLLDQVSLRNTELKLIAENLVLNNYDTFYKTIEEDSTGIKTFNIKVQDNYPNERWLVLRICAIDLLSKPVKNASDAMIGLLGSDRSLTDMVLYFERRSAEIQNTNYDDTTTAEKFYEEIIAIQSKVKRLPLRIQSKYYTALLRISVHISLEKCKEALQYIPFQLLEDKEIKMLCMQISIMEGTADIEQVVNICVKNNQYWLFNNFLIQFERKPERAREIIERYKFIISKDISVFLIYVEVVSITEGVEKGKALLESHEKLYSGYLEYWVEKVRFSTKEEARDLLENIYRKKDFSCCFSQTKVLFIRMLFEYEYYDEVLCEIENERIYGALVGDMVYIKAMALLKTNREIEAWDSFNTLFSKGRKDAETLFYLLILANRNKRDVDENILQIASGSNNPKVLLCLSNYYEWHQDLDLAVSTLMRSMFNTNGDVDEVFGSYIRIHCAIGTQTDPNLDISDNNSAIYIESLDGRKKKVFCIHKSRVLQQDPFEWGDATHLYKDTAIRKGLYRKKVGDLVKIDDESFRVVEILTLDCYLFRFSMQKMVETGKAKCIYTPMDEDGRMYIDELKKELLRNIDSTASEPMWLTHYKDISAVPVPIFFAERFERVNYLHLTFVMLRDSDIIIRESLQTSSPANTRYILSFTSIIALHEIGFNPEDFSVNLAISKSSLNEIDIETEQMISENSREHVASMGVKDGQLFFTESSEEMKQVIMQSAVSIKDFARKFNCVENDKDLQMSDDPQFDCKDFFGICDYDTISIAKEHDFVLVAFESVISAFAGFSGIEVDTIGMADFLAKVCDDANKLVGYVNRMFEMRFMFPFTFTVLKKLSACYAELSEQEQQVLVSKWEHALRIPFGDEKYKAIIAENARSVLLQAYETIDASNPIWELFVKYTLRYLGINKHLFRRMVEADSI